MRDGQTIESASLLHFLPHRPGLAHFRAAEALHGLGFVNVLGCRIDVERLATGAVTHGGIMQGQVAVMADSRRFFEDQVDIIPEAECVRSITSRPLRSSVP